MDEDERLLKLIAAARQHPKGTLLWRKAMERLLTVVQGFPEFSKYWHSNRIEELDALNRTWNWVCQNLSSFQPRQTTSAKESLADWIWKGCLEHRLKDIHSERKRKKEDQVSVSLESTLDWRQAKTTYLFERTPESGILRKTQSKSYIPDGIEVYITQLEKEAKQRLVQEFLVYIELDPKNRLRNCYPRNHPECNSQLLSQRLLFIFKNPPDSLAGIAEKFNIKYKTLHHHWNQKAIPLLQEVLMELGYHNVKNK